MSTGRYAPSNLERTRRTGRVGHGGIRACQRQPATTTEPAMHRFLQPPRPQKRSKNGAVSGAEVPVLVPFSFPRIVTVFPFLHSWNPGTGRLTRGKTEAHKRKETPRQPRGFVEKHCILKRSAEAERQGFEPWVPVRALRFSRPVACRLNHPSCFEWCRGLCWPVAFRKEGWPEN